MKIKSVLNRKKIIIILIIDFIVALILDGLSFFKTYDPSASCKPPECLGEHATLYYGYPYHFLYFKPAGFNFFIDKFLYNLIIYLIITFIFSLILVLIKNKIRKNNR